MATTAKNTLVQEVGVKKLINYPIIADGTFDINQGDLVYWDSTAKIVKPIDSNANAANVAGVAAKSSFLNLYGTKKYEPSMEVLIGQIHSLKTTAAETYEHLTAVGIGADAQTVSTAASNKVGYVILRNGQSAVTGASGVNIDVLVVVKQPVTAL